jgi:hypothetical protein
MSRDLRRYNRQTNFRLIVGALIVMFVVGDGLIYLFFGSSAAVSGLMCMGAGLVPIGITALALELLGWLVRKIDRD